MGGAHRGHARDFGLRRCCRAVAVGSALLSFAGGSAAQPDPGATPAIEALAPLVGTWRSRLDERYRDHPAEYNAESELLFEGTYRVRRSGDVERRYTVTYPDGTTDRDRELWVWRDEGRNVFDWITERWTGERYEAGDVIVEFRRLS